MIGFGPDTGHLRWAGIEPAGFIRRYADRLGGIHIKDVFPDYIDPEQTAPRSYHELAATKRLWCEPGLGVVDFDAVLAALPDDYDGDFMIEIDEPSVDSRFESHRISYEWAPLPPGQQLIQLNFGSMETRLQPERPTPRPAWSRQRPARPG